MRPWFGAIMIFILSSCGYRFGEGVLSEQYSTISVPYVEGDRDGDLTAELIKQMSSSGAFAYASSGGDLILLAKVVDYSEQNIGFRYDRKKSGTLKNDIVPSEARMQVAVDVSLVDAASNRVLRGPTRITAWVDFDHDYYTTRNRVNIFSLGQLSDIDEAREAVLRPLHQKISRNIVDYITYSW